MIAQPPFLSQMPRRWMPTALTLFFSNSQDMRTIHLKGFDRCSLCGSKSDDASRRQTEVCGPDFAARIEDGNFRSSFYIDDGLPHSFPQRGAHTGKREIFRGRRASRRLGNDVVNVERATHEADFRRLWAAATALVRQAARLQTEWSETYALFHAEKNYVFRCPNSSQV